MSGRVQAAIVVLATVCTIALIAMARRHGPWPAPWDEIVLELFVGCLFVGAGVLVGRWRPGMVTSWLLVLAGALVLAGLLAWSNSPLLFTVGGVVAGFEFAVVGHVVLALPDGRSHTPLDRWLVGCLYGLAIVTSVVPNLFYECRTPLGTGCAGNLLLIHDDPTLVTRTEEVLGPVAALVVLTVVVRAQHHTALPQARTRRRGRPSPSGLRRPDLPPSWPHDVDVTVSCGRQR